MPKPLIRAVCCPCYYEENHVIYSSSAVLCCTVGLKRPVLVHLLAGWGQFVGIGGQHSEVVDNGLKMRDLSQHGNFSILKTGIMTDRKVSMPFSITETLQVRLQLKPL